VSELNIAVMGTGRIGSLHTELLQQRVEGARVTAVYDVSAESAGSVGARFGVPVAGSPASIFDDPSVDAVAICTSTDTHVRVMIEAARAGKAIFCEKPISLALDQVDRALAAVARAGVYLQVGFNRRFDPSHAAVRDAVASGRIGDVHLVRITSRDPEPPPIPYVKVSGGIFLDMTIHDFDMARFVTGSDVTEVYAKGDVLVDPDIGAAGDLDTAVIMLTHENRAITTIDNSRRAVYGYDQRVEAFGSGGMATSANPLDTTTVIHDAGGGHGSPLPYFFTERYIPSYLAEWQAFVDAVRSGAPSPVDGTDGRAPLVIGLAAWKSIREQRPVLTSEIG
jgi:myo-inositol 2-dehydrogenase/D-chiro-inositol 1-dehydrogenase